MQFDAHHGMSLFSQPFQVVRASVYESHPDMRWWLHERCMWSAVPWRPMRM